MPEKLGHRPITLYRRWSSKPSLSKRNAKDKMVSEEALQIAEKRREEKKKKRRERQRRKGKIYHLNAEFQRIVRKDKKA